MHTVEGQHVPGYEITEQLEEIIKNLKEYKVQILQTQVRNKIRGKMQDDSLITPSALMELYEKQKYEAKKLDQRKKNLRQGTILRCW